MTDEEQPEEGQPADPMMRVDCDKAAVLIPDLLGMCDFFDIWAVRVDFKAGSIEGLGVDGKWSALKNPDDDRPKTAVVHPIKQPR